MNEKKDVFSQLVKPIKTLVEERGFAEPTDPQVEAIPHILEGKNVLLIAPTGTGKTEAAILPILSKFIEIPEKPPGIKILYITPLRALNRDLLERLIWWCQRLDIRLAVRHGDTETKERTKQARSPPDILITTPETLQAILTGRLMRSHLRAVKWVIVDEIHEFAEDKRGSQLSLALERLRLTTLEDFQTIGLSATIGSPEKVAKFLVGNDRPVEIVRVPVARYMKISILYPQPKHEDYELASKLYTHPEVAARLRVIRDTIKNYRSVLLFTNTRAIAEVLASRFKVWDINFPISIHHGSLAKPARVSAERGLKNGKLKGLVCVSGDSKVLLSNGQWTSIRELGDRSNGELSILSLSHSLKVKPAIAQSVKETGNSQLIRLSTKSGFQLKCTRDHRFLTINENGELDWIGAQDLTVGSPVALVRGFQYTENSMNFFDFLSDNIYIRVSKVLRERLREVLKSKYRTYVNMARFLPFSKDSICDYLSRGKAIPHNRCKLLLREAGLSLDEVHCEIVGVGSRNYVRGRIPLYVNENVTRFIGFLLAEGSISRAGTLRLFNADLPLLQRYIDILRREFNLLCNVTQGADGVWRARTHATWLCQIFKNMGIKSGRKATKISVPPAFFSLSSKLIFSFLAGYFDGCGHFEKNGEGIYSASFSTFSESMARDLQLILLNQGILSTCRKNKPKEQGGNSGYTVAVMGGQHLRKFLNNCHIWRNHSPATDLKTNEGYLHRDSIPNIGNLLKFIRKKAGLTTYRLQKGYKINPYKYETNQGTITQEKLSKLIDIYQRFTNVPRIIKLVLQSDIYWDYIDNIENIDSTEPVYDVFDVGGFNNFIVNGFITHNCTSSLELGIDVGRIDMCIQYMSPRQVTRLVQRVGRSGHRIGRSAKGIIITMDSDDTLEAMVITRRALKEVLEPVSIPERPLDALTHQIVGILMTGRKWRFNQILELFKGAYPYRNLTEEELVKVLTYLHTRYPRLAWVSFDDRVVIKPYKRKAMYQYYYQNLSMIPDEKHYLVVDESSDTGVGLLDEAFVAEYGELGTKFICRGTAWKITSIDVDRIYVEPVDDPTGAIPSWVGEEIPVPYEVACEVGQIREFVMERLNKNLKPGEIASILATRYPADEDTILRAVKETVEQVERGYPVPTDKRITVEDWEDYVVLNTSFGTLVNRTLSRLIGYMLSEKVGSTIGVQHDPYRIIIKTLGVANSDDVIEILKELPDVDVAEMAVAAAVKTGLFKRRLIHVARKFGALAKEVDFSNVSLQHLIESFEGSAIYDEAVKETMRNDMDVANTVRVLNMIRNGKIGVVKLETDGEATPVSRVGIQRISMKTDLIPPERMRRILVESARARLLNDVRTFVCTNCWGFLKMIRIKDLPEKLLCPRCGSDEIGVMAKTAEELQNLCDKKGKSLTKDERKLVKYALQTAKLMSKYGSLTALVLCGNKLNLSDVEGILLREDKLSDRLFELVVEAEKNALKRKFW